MQPPPPYGYNPPPQGPYYGQGYPPPPGYPPPYGQHPYYGYPPPPRSSGVSPLVWVFLGLGLLAVFGLAGVFAIGMAKGFRDASRAASAPTYAPYSGGGGYGSGGLGSSTDDDDDDDDSDDPQMGVAPNLPLPHRDVPVHDVKILSGCSSADLKVVETQIDDAIDVGAPAYNRGDFLGCYTTYDQAAKDIEAALPKSCKGPTKALEDGRAKARAKTTSADRAWAMRDAFDGLLDVIGRKGPDL